MAAQFIKQDMATLEEAYKMRKEEYEILHRAGKWQGAVLHAGFVLELALKIAICKKLDEPNLPRLFQVHDLELLLYCSGLRKTFESKPDIYRNFGIILKHWSIELRYERMMITSIIADEVYQALFDSSNGLLTFLSTL